MKKSEVVMGSSKKRADIVVYEKERVGQAYIIVELKGPANPPFAGDIDDEVILVNSVTAKNSGGKKQRKVSRDILFIERNLNFLKSGGRSRKVDLTIRVISI